MQLFSYERLPVLHCMQLKYQMRCLAWWNDEIAYFSVHWKTRKLVARNQELKPMSSVKGPKNAQNTDISSTTETYWVCTVNLQLIDQVQFELR